MVRQIKSKESLLLLVLLIGSVACSSVEDKFSLNQTKVPTVAAVTETEKVAIQTSATSEPIPSVVYPILQKLIFSELEVPAEDGVFSLPGEVSPGDSIELEAIIVDDTSGTLTVLGETRFYSADGDPVGLRVTFVDDMLSNEIPVFLVGKDGETAEYLLHFEPSSEWAPTVVLESSSGLTGKVILEVRVVDLNGGETAELLGVEQEFNFQDTGNKEIEEYISNQGLAPFNIAQIESDLYSVTFNAEWPGRFPLHFTVEDKEGHLTEKRVPIIIRPSEQLFDIKSVSINLWGDPRDPLFGQDPELIYDAFKYIAHEMNANYVMININGAMDSQISTEITPCYDLPSDDQWCITPTPEELHEWVQAAHDEGLGVILVPVLTVDHWNAEAYQLQPSNWNEFFQEYSDFVLNLAEISQEEDVEILSVNFAMGELNRYTSDWRLLFEQTREIYTGDILIQSFWPYPSFFDEADVIGLHFFHGGTSEMDPRPEELLGNFRGITDYQVLPVWEKYEKPILFTELGCFPLNGSSIEPLTTWQRLANPTYDWQEQVDYYEMAMRSMLERPGTTGVSIWVFYLYPSSRMKTPDWFVSESPASDLVGIWYSDEFE